MNTLKFVLFFILAGFLLCYSCYGQEKTHYKCFYQFDMLRDTTKNEYFRREIYIVQIGENLTKGFTYQKFYLDSLQKSSPELYRNLFSASVKESMEAMRRTGDISYIHNNSFTYGAFASDLYKDYKKDEIQVRDNISIHSFIYKDELKPQNWEILSDTTTILGYQCQKAQCQWRGRDWVAWFTPEIPINEGPWKFYGLPGLIMKLQDTKSQYSFEIIGLQQVNEPMYMTIKKDSRKIDRLTFLKLKMGVTGIDLNAMDMEKAGLYPDTEKKRYDDIERDYK